jgi:ATP-dependent Clp protease ATP-binding subunit ClpA
MDADEEAIKRLFTPEFRNRLDATIGFSALDRSTILHVVDKFLVELEMQLAEKKVELEVSHRAKAWLSEHGHDPLMGARPMARLIQDRIKKPLAEAILFGELQKGGVAKVGMKGGNLSITYPATVS